MQGESVLHRGLPDVAASWGPLPFARFDELRYCETTMIRRLLLPAAAVAGLSLFSQQRTPPDWEERRKQMSIPWEQKGLAEPFKGVTTNGTVQPGVFGIRSTGVSTAPVRKAAEEFLASLTPAQRTKTKFPLDSDEWRKTSGASG